LRTLKKPARRVVHTTEMQDEPITIPKDLKMNRITITWSKKGIVRICSDEPVELYEITPFVPRDRVFLRDIEIGSKFVDEELGSDPIGHYHDEQFGKLSPGMPSGRAFAIARAMSKP
jgi:hypothetical protein